MSKTKGPNHPFFRGEDPSLRQYFRNIENSKPLSREKEAELATLIQEGDIRARDKLVEANLRFVIETTKQFRNRGVPMSDLISAGNMGLITAAERFDHTRGFKFITCAVWWIRQAMQIVAEEHRTIRLPINKLNELKTIGKAARELGQGREVDPTPEEIAEHLGRDPEEIVDTLTVGQPTSSLDQVLLGGDNDDLTLLHTIPDESKENPDVKIDKESAPEDVQRCLACLNEREQRILTAYFGLGDEEPITLEEIGAHLKLTRERVRQIKEKALVRLRDSKTQGPVLKTLLEAFE